MFVRGLPVGPLQANCFIIGCPETGEAAVIDPGAEAGRILKVLDKENLKLKYIIDTHGHFDHIGANGALRERTGAPILIHCDDGPMLTDAQLNGSLLWRDLGSGTLDGPAADRLVEDGEETEVGRLTLRFIHTPGHTPGGMCILLDDLVITGDTLFQGSIGRTDFPGGSFEVLMDSIHQKLLVLEDSVRVLPGHGPETTIGEERRHNPFILGLA